MSDRQPNIQLRNLNSAEGAINEAVLRVDANGGVLQFNNDPAPSINSIRRNRNLKVLLFSSCIAMIILALFVFFYRMFM
jgi:t-SNARE complex subunit (syntaxin)